MYLDRSYRQFIFPLLRSEDTPQGVILLRTADKLKLLLKTFFPVNAAYNEINVFGIY